MEQVILGLLGQVAVLSSVRLDPGEAAPRVVEAPVVDVGEAEHRRQEQPLPAAVVLVLEVAVHAAVRRAARPRRARRAPACR